MPNRQHHLLAICLILFSQVALSLPTAPDVNFENFKPVGRASLKVLWFNIYDATLSTPSGQFLAEELSDAEKADENHELPTPIALELIYKRNISSEALVKETRKQLTGKLDEQTLSAGLEHIANLWPDISKGDALTFYLANNSLGHFYYNSEYLGSITQENFAAALINIWIGPGCQYPKLAKQLKGLNP